MKPGKRRNGAPIVLLIIIIIAGAGVFAEMKYNIISDAFRQSRKTLMPDGVVFEYESEAVPVFSGGKDGFLCVTKDGAVFNSYKGEIYRAATFTMQSPRVLKRGETWAILEPRGRTVYVCGKNGLIYSVSPEYPVINAYLNDIQCLILILEAESGYKIRIYNAQGIETITRSYEMDGVYPVCAALSDDGYIFGVSCLDTTKTTITSSLQYFYTDSGAKRYGGDTQTPFKAIEKPGAVIANISFDQKGNLAAFSDTELFVTTSRGEEVFAYELGNRLSRYQFGENVLGFVTGAALTNAQDSLSAGIAKWFDYGGKPLGEYPATEEEGAAAVESISFNDESVLIKSINGYILTDLSGRELWTYGASGDIIDIIPIDKKRAVIAKQGRAELYSLKRRAKNPSNQAEGG